MNQTDPLYTQFETNFCARANQVLGKKSEVLSFAIQEPNGHTLHWTARHESSDNSLTIGKAKSFDCEMSLTRSDLELLASGKMNPQMAFMTGKLKVCGDLGLATKMEKLFL